MEMRRQRLDNSELMMNTMQMTFIISANKFALLHFWSKVIFFFQMTMMEILELLNW